MNAPRTHRPLIIGRRAAIATNHPLATQVGRDVLRAGGNAVDAAVAVSLALGVVEPHMSGLGADGFYHTFNVADARGRAGSVYNGSGPAPEALIGHVERDRRLHLTGPLSVGIPGALAALAAMHEDQGSLAWSTLCAPAIQLAVDGFGVTQTYRRFVQGYGDKILCDNVSRMIYLREGKPPELGEFVTQPLLAETLQEIAVDGAQTFYRGPLAKRIANDLSASGVQVRHDELAAFQAERQLPLTVAYRGYEIRQTPPNSTGFVHLLMLMILERFDLASYGHLSAESIHLMVEAKKLAFQVRERYAGDPDFNHIPLEEILDDRLADQLAGQIDMRVAASTSAPQAAAPDETGNLAHTRISDLARRHSGNTTYFCVVDAAGNAVSGIQSLNHAFGSGVTTPRTGFLLNNRMINWHLDTQHPNRLAAGKRVRHTMNAPIVCRDGMVWALFGTPGSDDQVQTNTQIAVGLMDFDLDPQTLCEAPRWSSNQPGQSSNWPHEGSDRLTIESDMPEMTRQRLMDLGHRLVLVDPLHGPCSVSCIRVLGSESGRAVLAGSDPRRDGWAAAL